MIQLVIFDLTGTTLKDTGDVPAAFQTALESFGIQINDSRLMKFRGASKREVFRQTLPNLMDAEQAYIHFQDILIDRYRSNGVGEIPGALSTFLQLRQKEISIALNTGFDRTIVQVILDQLHWDSGLFDAIVCGDDVLNGRPAPDLILRCMQQCHVSDPSAVANVGDTAVDLQAGSRAGIGYNIAVLSGAHPLELLQQQPHTHIIPSVRELPELLIHIG